MAVIFMKEELWHRFLQSGSVSDYLRYKQEENEKAEQSNANNNQGLGYQRTDGWGK